MARGELAQFHGPQASCFTLVDPKRVGRPACTWCWPPSDSIDSAAHHLDEPLRKVALQVGSQVDSRIILDEGGADRLLGTGDLLANLGHRLVRAYGAVNA